MDTTRGTLCMDRKTHKIDSVSFDFQGSEDGCALIEIVVNGYYDTPDIIYLSDTPNPFSPIIEWLEHILTHPVSEASDLEIKSPYHGGKHYQLHYQNDEFYVIDYSSGLIKARSLCKTENFVRDIYVRMRWDLEKLKMEAHSDIIESYFLSKPDLHFEYKEYYTTAKIKERDLRYYGDIYDKEDTEPTAHGSFAADNEKEAKQQFESGAEYALNSKKWSHHNKEWANGDIDIKSVGYVFDIMPEKFKERIATGKFDKMLLDRVPGGDYVVPLYYVTKAWDVLLKGPLEHYAFMIGPEEDDEDDYDAALKEFMEEEYATRTRAGAIKDNDKIKSIWKEMLGVDIDNMEVDFTQFDKHLPPHVSEEKYEDYFFDVPNGVFEWVLSGINHPNGRCTFESVSALMEFTALIVDERKKWM